MRTTVPGNTVIFRCVCGREVGVIAQLLSKVIVCPCCGRYVRVALRFLLVDKAFAPNLTVQCGCGRFIVETPDKAGKPVRCTACKRRLVMPQPVVRFDSDGVVRVPRKVLQNQLQKIRKKWQQDARGTGGPRLGPSIGRPALRVGETVCPNEECGERLPAGANVCARCGTNRLTGEGYVGVGPAADPVGKWKEL